MQCRISIRRSRARWLLQEPFLILGCSTSSLHHSWNNLVQNVVDIFCTLLRHDFPLPELLYASTDRFLGLPKRGKFVTEPVRCSFLIMRVMPERLTTKPSPFKVFNIPAGWRPWLWRSSGVAMAANNAGHTRLRGDWNPCGKCHDLLHEGVTLTK